MSCFLRVFLGQKIEHVLQTRQNPCREQASYQNAPKPIHKNQHWIKRQRNKNKLDIFETTNNHLKPPKKTHPIYAINHHKKNQQKLKKKLKPCHKKNMKNHLNFPIFIEKNTSTSQSSTSAATPRDPLQQFGKSLQLLQETTPTAKWKATKPGSFLVFLSGFETQNPPT